MLLWIPLSMHGFIMVGFRQDCPAGMHRPQQAFPPLKNCSDDTEASIEPVMLWITWPRCDAPAAWLT